MTEAETKAAPDPVKVALAAYDREYGPGYAVTKGIRLPAIEIGARAMQEAMQEAAHPAKAEVRALDLATLLNHAFACGALGGAWTDYDCTDLACYHRIAKACGVPAEYYATSAVELAGASDENDGDPDHEGEYLCNLLADDNLMAGDIIGAMHRIKDRFIPEKEGSYTEADVTMRGDGVAVYPDGKEWQNAPAPAADNTTGQFGKMRAKDARQAEIAGIVGGIPDSSAAASDGLVERLRALAGVLSVWAEGDDGADNPYKLDVKTISEAAARIEADAAEKAAKDAEIGHLRMMVRNDTKAMAEYEEHRQKMHTARKAVEAERDALLAFRDAVYAEAGKRPSIGETEPPWMVDLFEVERRAALAKQEGATNE